MLIVLETVGIVAVGALAAVRARLDVFGVIVLAIVTAVGGGILRDLLLGVNPPVGLLSWEYLTAGAVTAVAVFLLPAGAARLHVPVQLADALGLAVFSVAGTVQALDRGVPVYAAALVGVVNGVGGGALREIILGQVPLILRKKIYAVAALAGCLLLPLGRQLQIPDVWAVPAAAALIVVIRVLTLFLNWHLAVARAPVPVEVAAEPDPPAQPRRRAA